MPKKSAGILLFRKAGKKLELLLAHPGGPLWAKKDNEAWSIPKGEFEDGADPLTEARREFEEETAHRLPDGNYIALGTVKQKSGKIVHGFALEHTFDETQFVSNTFEMEWPPRSGKKKAFPEIDKLEWFSVEEAKEKINPAQAKFIDELLEQAAF